MKRLVALLLVLALGVSLFATTVFAANPFTDISTKDWFYDDIISAYDMGLINGKTATQYKPNDYLTYAEAVKLAACMNQRYMTGAVTLENGKPQWYQSYVDYSKGAKIITKDYAWNQPATRAGYMEIFANALPDDALPAINEVPDGSIPDVSMKHPQAAAIYKLYRAGILQGVNAAHNCNPASNIKRAEVAAILNRMMDSTARIEFSMDSTKLRFTEQPKDTAVGFGVTAEVSVEVAGGKEPYSYQWFITFDGIEWFEYEGAILPAMTLKAPESDDSLSPQVRCRVTDSGGEVIISEPATISVDSSGLSVVVETEGSCVMPGETAEFTAKASGGKAPYKYQWEVLTLSLGWVKLSDQTDSQLRAGVSEASIGEEMRYRCTVTDATGKSVTSDPAAYEVLDYLKITTEPYSVAAKVGDMPTFEIEVTGGKAPYAFTWFIGMDGGGVSVDGTTGFETMDEPAYGYSKMQVTITNGFVYTEEERYFFYCAVEDVAGNQVYSKSFSISVDSLRVDRMTYPAAETVKVNDTARYEVTVTGGTAPYNFSWEVKSSTSNGWATASILKSASAFRSGDGKTVTLKFTPTQTAQVSGSSIFSLRCRISDADGNVVYTDPVSVSVVK